MNQFKEGDIVIRKFGSLAGADGTVLRVGDGCEVQSVDSGMLFVKRIRDDAKFKAHSDYFELIHDQLVVPEKKVTRKYVKKQKIEKSEGTKARILSEKEYKDIEEKLYRKKVLTYKDIAVKLKVKQSMLIPKEECAMDRAVGAELLYVARKNDMKFSCRRLVDGSAWLITRVQ